MSARQEYTDTVINTVKEMAKMLGTDTAIRLGDGVIEYIELINADLAKAKGNV